MSESSKTKFSDEFLNAFVDGQLTPDEKSRALVEISQDEAVNRQVCELRKLRDLVQLAYADLPVPPRSALNTGARHRLGLGLAAGIALVVGMAVGWVLHQPQPPSPPAVVVSPAIQHTVSAKIMHASTTPATAAKRAESTLTEPRSPVIAHPVANLAAAPVVMASAPVADAPEDAPTKILFQINRGSVAALGSALDDIESLAQFYREQHQDARIEVVINGEGLNLVRTDVTVHAERIRRLLQDYDNLTFAACQNTIDRLRREQGIRAQLLPGVIVIDSGVAQIMRRQQQGWAYIQV
jgi:intracellular sulfur oxidation DsrE/DsrF family protein